jgi:chemotaxis signal transduction protein
VPGVKLTDTANLLDFEELRSSFDQTFQQARVERDHELVHLLVVRIGAARFALKVCDLAGLARAQTIVPIPATDPGLLGLAGLKGRLVAVYSLAAEIGTAALTTAPDRWIVLCRCDRGIALAFNAAEGTMMARISDLFPAEHGAPMHATDAVGAGPARLWLLNVNSIAAAIVAQTGSPASDQS